MTVILQFWEKVNPRTLSPQIGVDIWNRTDAKYRYEFHAERASQSMSAQNAKEYSNIGERGFLFEGYAETYTFQLLIHPENCCAGKYRFSDAKMGNSESTSTEICF